MSAPGPTGPSAGAADARAVGAADAGAAGGRRGALRTPAVAALVGVILLVVGATLGVALAPQRSASPAATSSIGATTSAVDIGFAQDMIVHHGQGVLMAHFEELNGTDADTLTMAYDINYTQTAQLGQMQGWLALWGAPPVDEGVAMSWMTAGAGQAMSGMGSSAVTSGMSGMAAGGTDPANGVLMPGMAGTSEVAKLKTLHGKESDVYFLQLMIRHHQGGAGMMRYASKDAANSIVRNFAGKMLEAQTSEISVMTGMLAGMGATPLPYTQPAMPTG